MQSHVGSLRAEAGSCGGIEQLGALPLSICCLPCGYTVGTRKCAVRTGVQLQAHPKHWHATFAAALQEPLPSHAHLTRSHTQPSNSVSSTWPASHLRTRWFMQFAPKLFLHRPASKWPLTGLPIPLSRQTQSPRHLAPQAAPISPAPQHGEANSWPEVQATQDLRGLYRLF